jgi:hypothetical protein
MLSFSHKGCTSGPPKGDCREIASPLVPRKGGSKGDLKVQKIQISSSGKPTSSVLYARLH